MDALLPAARAVTNLPGRLRAAALVAAAALLAACGAPDVSARPARPAGGDSSGAIAAATVVDSALPIAELLRRAQARIHGPPPRDLEGGAPTLDSLFARYVDALAARDTTTLGRLAITPAEFVYLYYPESPYGRPPYNLAPDFVWMFMRENGAKGTRLAIRDYGGRGWRYRAHDCGARPRQEGANRVWGPCRVTIVSPAGAAMAVPFVNNVIERDGRAKFLSYASEL